MPLTFPWWGLPALACIFWAFQAFVSDDQRRSQQPDQSKAARRHVL
jgi:hypothetical protein